MTETIAEMTEARKKRETRVTAETEKGREDQGHVQDLMKEGGGGIKRNETEAADPDQVEAGAVVEIREGVAAVEVVIETVETVINQHMTMTTEKENMNEQTPGK